MKGNWLKITTAFIVFFLLACVGVNVALRFSPPMAAFIVGALFVAFLVCLLLVVLSRRGAADMPAPDYEDPVERSRRLLAAEYEALSARISVPADAGVIDAPSALFAPDTVSIPHYIWRTESELWLFPRWDGLESCLSLLEYLDGQDAPRRIGLYPLRIPLECVRYFARITPVADGDTFTLLLYQGALRDDIGLMLSQDAYEVLDALLPGMNLQDLQKRAYPASARQIFDITAQMQQLKELYTETLIDEREYALKKAELLKKL